MAFQRQKKVRIKFTEDCESREGSSIREGTLGKILVEMEYATAIEIDEPFRIVVIPYSIKNPEAPFKVIE